MPSGELTDVAVEMLDAHPIVGAVIASLHRDSEFLYSVDVRQFVDIFADAMLDHLVIVSMIVRVTLEVIRIDVLTWHHDLKNESLQGDFLGTRYDVGLDLITVPVLDSDDCGLADRPSAIYIHACYLPCRCCRSHRLRPIRH